MRSRTIVWLRGDNGECVLLAGFRSFMVTPAETTVIKAVLNNHFQMGLRDTFIFVPEDDFFRRHWRGREPHGHHFCVSSQYDEIGAAICRAVPRLAPDFQTRRDAVPKERQGPLVPNDPALGTRIVCRMRRLNKYHFPRYRYYNGILKGPT